MPEDPVSIGLSEARDLDESNFRFYAAKYRAEVENAPQATLVMGKAFHGKGDTGSDASEFEVKIPEHYKVTKIAYAYSTRASNPNPNYQLIIGDEVKSLYPSGSSQGGRPKFGNDIIYYTETPFDHESIPVTITGWDLGSFSVNLKCTLQRTAQAFADWQIRTYDAIIRAYHDRLEEFENQTSDFQDDGNNDVAIKSIILSRDRTNYFAANLYFLSSAKRILRAKLVQQ